MQISISPGNRKMGQVPSISLPPGITCRKNAPCRKDCYANKAIRMYPTAVAAYKRNLSIYRNSPEEFFNQVSGYFSTHKLSCRFFRFHVAGDFPDKEYLAGCIEVANAFPDVRFLAFTKQYELIAGVSFPENFTVIASAWPGLPMPRPIRKQFRIAWVQDGTEKRVPKTAMHCPGYCEACGLCWEIKKVDRDVCFDKH